MQELLNQKKNGIETAWLEEFLNIGKEIEIGVNPPHFLEDYPMPVR